ncbi:YbgC/FadM family acyl-CoA thioesterase [Marinicellulosiphila megalodicopiae]|uniref:YbgC/FadM family acyl-CoA thioesterase n=1 Tax=Marinicellulosiphila megalodicopiae TaxID=2724896 RepID=UPI003BAE377B
MNNQNKEYLQDIRVYIEDTDCGGIVYHANYIKFMERVRSDFIRKCGYEFSTSEKQGYTLVVASLSLQFKASAKMDDVLSVGAIVKKVTPRSFVVTQNVYRDGQLLVSGEIKIASIATSSGKLCPMPDVIVLALKKYLIQSEEK